MLNDLSDVNRYMRTRGYEEARRLVDKFEAPDAYRFEYIPWAVVATEFLEIYHPEWSTECGITDVELRRYLERVDTERAVAAKKLACNLYLDVKRKDPYDGLTERDLLIRILEVSGD